MKKLNVSFEILKYEAPPNNEFNKIVSNKYIHFLQLRQIKLLFLVSHLQMYLTGSSLT